MSAGQDGSAGRFRDVGLTIDGNRGQKTTLSRRDQVANILSVFAKFTNDLFSTCLVYCMI